MKILFTVQGEGRGHLTQALTLRQILAEAGHEVVGVIVGKSPARKLPDFFVQKINAPLLEVESPNFLPVAKNKRVPFKRSIAYNLLRSPRYVGSLRTIRREARKADVVVNFYELLTGLAFALFPPPCKLVCVAHQYLFLHPAFRFPSGHAAELFLLRFFTRLTALRADRLLALSFRDMSPAQGGRLQVVPPLLRREVRRATPRAGNYLHGYLLHSRWADDIVRWHRTHPWVALHFFWDKRDMLADYHPAPGLTFHPLNDELFIRYMAGARAYATTAGFESVCEAMYLGKPVLMVPTHIEQLCNACDAELAGAGVRCDWFDMDRLNGLQVAPSEGFRAWADGAQGRILAQIEGCFLQTAPFGMHCGVHKTC